MANVLVLTHLNTQNSDVSPLDLIDAFNENMTAIENYIQANHTFSYTIAITAAGLFVDGIMQQNATFTFNKTPKYFVLVDGTGAQIISTTLAILSGNIMQFDVAQLGTYTMLVKF